MSFKLLASTKVNDEIPVQKYVSTTTGIKVYLAQVNSPLTNAYLALATEADSDDGIPHTLEHLIFLGSEDYPFKGVLDLLANRCLANGTNAWTETDNTVYTLSCAGSEGLLRLLPVYLNHVLFPTLTKSAFITEVYSITENGEDNGAVYCEMQGRENSGESRGNLELLRNIFPNHGYSMETGGIMKNIRDSLTIEKIREYHAKFYQPENLAVIIAGQVNIDDIAKSIESIEKKILQKKSTFPEYEKPWQTPVKPLKETKDIKILFPSDEEECGLVYVGYHGPKATTEFETLTACYILMKYLCDTSVSPIQQSFIEIDDPFASRVSYNITENSTSLLFFSFENVPIDKIDFIYERLIQLLVDLANGVEKLDEQRLKTVFEKYILERLSSLENSPHDDITFHVLGDFLYADKVEDFQKRLNVTDIIAKLQDEKIDYWLNLLRKYFIDNHCVIVRTIPSISEKEKLSKEEADRLEARRKELGSDGLAKKGRELEEAMSENDKPPPLEMLTSLPIPSTDSIAFHQFDVIRKTDKNQKINLSQLPFYVEAYNLKSNFVYVTVAFDTSELPPELRSYLLLFLDLILESPVQINDELLPYEAVVSALEQDMISYETSLGLQSASRFGCGPFSNTVTFHMQVEVKKFEIAIGWMTHLWFHSVFTQDRVHIVASKLVNDIATAKRNGYDMAREISKAMYYKKNTNVNRNSVLSQYTFLTELVEGLKDKTQLEKVLNNLNELRGLLTPSLTVHVAANFEKITDLKTPLTPLIEKIEEMTKSTVDHLPVTFDYELMNKNGNLEKEFTGTIVGIGCVESGFLFCSSPGINKFMDEDLSAILLYLQYLSQLEGPMWKKIRKNSYGYNVVPKPNEGLIMFSLYRATNIYEAYKDAKVIIESQLEDGSEFDKTLLESARSSLIFEIIEHEKTVGDLVQQAMLNSFKCAPKNYNKILVDKVAGVTIEDLRRVGATHFSTMFKPGMSKVVIVCHPDKVETIKKQFEDFGHNLKQSSSLEASILNSCS
ncbi:CLUMA_CG017994, isoform A [Clunio marinus]|uniref:CLUMA_CG017994, isoform A n=1 Tax=Clunio marinus TaxID=568069 RepID=A0A1J1J1J6_9DIPT|nr:CLUMA_CG017994, isoform A [Clunio marinus]